MDSVIWDRRNVRAFKSAGLFQRPRKQSSSVWIEKRLFLRARVSEIQVLRRPLTTWNKSSEEGGFVRGVYQYIRGIQISKEDGRCTYCIKKQSGNRQKKGTSKGIEFLVPISLPFWYFLIRSRRKRCRGDNKFRCLPLLLESHRVASRYPYCYRDKIARGSREILHKVAYVTALSNPRQTALIWLRWIAHLVSSGTKCAARPWSKSKLARRYSPRTWKSPRWYRPRRTR